MAENKFPSHNDRLIQVIADYRQALDRGERPDCKILLEKHPDIAKELESFLENEANFNQPSAEASPRSISVKSLMSESPKPPEFDPNEPTVRFQGQGISLAVDARIPASIGRYCVESILGKGSFGLVYLAYDDQLTRPVAIKVPHQKLISNLDDARAYLTEARTVANLDHPNIVAVFDIGSTDEFPVFVVSKYIEGSDLATRLKQSRLSFHESVDLVAAVAEALHYAHRQRLVHRDVKPGNILLDKSGKPFVADFGLALREQDAGKGPRFAGTPAYMSPEQARGEGHRVDRRCDIFSLGIVFYELLTGSRPFNADSRAELLEQIINVEACPLRQLDDAIPKELERICLRSLSKRASERYTTAKDFADDLRYFLSKSPSSGESNAMGQQRDEAEITTAVPTPTTAPGSNSRSIKIVPKGLRSFDAQDADFFLELLPGPRDRNGLPDSIRFWKTLIEEPHTENTFSVGVIYGPSGCGKSSLMKAGLLPRLAKEVVAVYIEAIGNETETRLLKGLRRQLPDLPTNLSLVESLAGLRRGRYLEPRRKVLLVLDQFEQWLHSMRDGDDSELVQALRHCDGSRVQCIVMVRDDFWLAVSRFMQVLEIRIVEAENSKLVDLFDLRHARSVLAAFGRAFSALPDQEKVITKDEEAFLDLAVADLSRDGKVISLRLALFAEMVKGKVWTPATLKEVGGTEGIVVTFLEETFTATSAPPQHRLHQKAAQAVLKALLPEAGTDFKGHMASYSELRNASGYGSRPNDFENLIRILDGELRFITPTDPEGKNENSDAPIEAGARYYQLTHDYLVQSLRKWLTRKQKETRRGRAELLLADRAGVWNARPENRQLPSLWQWVSIRWLTVKKEWTQPQSTMMATAGRYHLRRAAMLCIVLFLASFAGFTIRERIVEHQSAEHAKGLVKRVLDARTAQVPGIVEEMSSYRRFVDPLLYNAIEQASDDPRRKLNLSLALLPVDHLQVDDLFDRLIDAEPLELSTILDALEPHASELLKRLWDVLESQDREREPEHLRAAAALAKYDPQNPQWDSMKRRVADELVKVPAVYLSAWIDLLIPVRGKLIGPLSEVFRDPRRRDVDRSFATDILADFAATEPTILAELIMDADTNSFEPLLRAVKKVSADAFVRWRKELSTTLQPPWEDPPLDSRWTPIEPRLAEKIRLADGVVHERFAYCLSLPLPELVDLCEALRPSGYRPTSIYSWLRGEAVVAGVVWTRDGANWRLHGPVDPESARRLDQEHLSTGLQPMVFVPIPPFFREAYALWGPPGRELHDPTTGVIGERRLQSSALPSAVPVNWSVKWHRFEPGKDRQPPADWTDAVAGQPFKENEFPNLNHLSYVMQADNEYQNVLIEARGKVSLPQGECRLWAVASNGIRVYFDDKLVIDRWVGNDGNPVVATVSAEAGQHDLRLEYFHFDGMLVLATRIGYSTVEFANIESDTEAPTTRRHFESSTASASNQSILMTKLRELVEADFRPFAVKGALVQAGQPSRVQIICRRPIVAEEMQDRLARRQTLACCALARLGQIDAVWPKLAFEPDPEQPATLDPRLRTELIHELPNYHVDVNLLLDRLESEPHASARRALLLALGQYPFDGDGRPALSIDAKKIPSDRRSSLIAKLLVDFENEPDAGLHGAIEWLLRKWGHGDDLRPIVDRLRPKDNISHPNLAVAGRQWFVNLQAQTFTVFPAGEFAMGSPDSEPGRNDDERLHRRQIKNSFALATTEVTRAEYLIFAKSTDNFEPANQYVKTHDSPQTGISWFRAAQYCNWLSEQEGIERDQWCFEPNEMGKYGLGMKAKAEFLDLIGYRLPLEAEWEFACRAGTKTSRYYGNSEARLGDFAWYLGNSEDRTHPVAGKKPNDAGLFDMFGNAIEWCHDAQYPYPVGKDVVPPLTEISSDMDASLSRVLRGGTFDHQSSNERSAFRGNYVPSFRAVTFGFRLARTLPLVAKKNPENGQIEKSDK